MSLPEYKQVMADDADDQRIDQVNDTSSIRFVNYTVNGAKAFSGSDHVRARQAHSKTELVDILSAPGLFPRLSSVPYERITVSVPFSDCELRPQAGQHPNSLAPTSVTKWARLMDDADAWNDVSLTSVGRMMVTVERSPGQKFRRCLLFMSLPMALVLLFIAMVKYMDD